MVKKDPDDERLRGRRASLNHLKLKLVNLLGVLKFEIDSEIPFRSVGNIIRNL